MSNYVVSDGSLTSVADAIRTKGGTSAPLAFPGGFVSAIADIPTGKVYPDSYVTDGLYFCLDAINNAGDHHDANAESWVDTIGGIEFTQMDTELPIFGSNFVYFDRTNKRLHNTADTIAVPIYCEFILQIEARQSEYIFQTTDRTKLGSLSYNGGSSGLLNLVAQNVGLYASFYPDIGRIISYGGSLKGVVYNGGRDYGEESINGWTNAAQHIIGGYISNTLPFLGYLCAIRYYNRILTREETEQNFAQDVKRFGAGGSFTLTDLFNALPMLPSGTHRNLQVDATKLAEASQETISIATNKGWVIA